MKVMYLNCGLKRSLKCVILGIFFNATYVVTRKAWIDYKPVNDGYRSIGLPRYDKSRDKKKNCEDHKLRFVFLLEGACGQSSSH